MGAPLSGEFVFLLAAFRLFPPSNFSRDVEGALLLFFVPASGPGPPPLNMHIFASFAQPEFLYLVFPFVLGRVPNPHTLFLMSTSRPLHLGRLYHYPIPLRPSRNPDCPPLFTPPQFKKEFRVGFFTSPCWLGPPLGTYTSLFGSAILCL